MNIVDFYRQRFGDNWVLSRRTPNIIARYGNDVNCLTKKQYDAATRDYREAYGDPHDKARAGMYLALKAIHTHLENGDDCPAVMKELARAAIALELTRGL